MHDSFLKNTSICFDLDGTLVDTAPDLIRVLNLVIGLDGLTPVRSHEVRPLIGFGALAMIHKAYARAGRDLDEEMACTHLKRFLKLYAQDLSRESRPYPGVPDILRHLKQAGASLSVCTNKPGAMARPLLESLSLSRFFDRIIGSEDTRARKPAAEHIFTAAGHRGQKPIIMVGDGAPDVLAARAAGVPVILMRYGYSPVSMEALGAVSILRSFRELPSALTKLLG